MTLTAAVIKSASDASNGQIVTYTGSNPAGDGTEWSETVPTGRVWRILSIRATLVTDANAANRQVGVTLSDGTNVFFKSCSTSVQAASLTHSYTIADLPGAVVASAALEHQVPLPSMLLPAGTVIASVTTAKQATDNWGAPVFCVEEFFSAAP
jgi:hypothetical protein